MKYTDPKRTIVAIVLLPVLVAGFSTYLAYREPGVALVDFERRYESAFISGFHDHERSDGRGLRWTARDAFISLKNLPAGSHVRIEARVKGLRPRGIPLPRIRFTANGATVFETLCDPGLVTYRFSVPLRGRSLRLGIHPEIWVPTDHGRKDARVLGIQVFSVRVEPQGGTAIATRPVLWMILAASALVAAGLIAGLSLPVSSIATTLAAAGFAQLLSEDSVRYLPYAQSVALLAAACLTLSLLLRVLLARLNWLQAEERPLAIAFLVGSFLFKMAVVFFPLFVSSDGDFHANRLINVLDGDFHTTSVSQHDPPFRIPYPVSLYLLAAPWATAGLDKVAVIKALCVVFDLATGLVLINLARRFLNDFRAGVLAALLYQLVPINWLVFSAGNFTNIFGVAASVFFVGCLLGAYTSAGRTALIGTFLFSTLALTAHFGTFLFAIVLWPLLLVMVPLMAPGISTGRTRVVTMVVAASMAVALLYYVGYWDLVASQWERALTRDYMSSQENLTGPAAKLSFNLPFYREQLGLLFAVVALVGAILILRRPSASPLHAACLAWTAATLLFFLADLFTAVELRYVLQVTPMMAIFAGSYLSGAVERGKFGKLATVVVLIYLGTVAVDIAYQSAVIRYH